MRVVVMRVGEDEVVMMMVSESGMMRVSESGEDEGK